MATQVRYRQWPVDLNDEQQWCTKRPERQPADGALRRLRRGARPPVGAQSEKRLGRRRIGVADEPRVVRERVPIRFLDSAHLTHHVHAARARLDQWHGHAPFEVTRCARDGERVAAVIRFLLRRWQRCGTLRGREATHVLGDDRYLRIVGVRFTEIDDLEAQIAETLHHRTPSDQRAWPSTEGAGARIREIRGVAPPLPGTPLLTQTRLSSPRRCEYPARPSLVVAMTLLGRLRRVVRSKHPNVGADGGADEGSSCSEPVGPSARLTIVVSQTAGRSIFAALRSPSYTCSAAVIPAGFAMTVWRGG